MFEAPTVIVTGASTGIGADFCDRALSLGWNVIATARNTEKIKFSPQKNLRIHSLDVTSDASVTGFANWLDAQNLSRPLFLVNNAGLAIAGPVEGVSLADWSRQLDTNVLGVVRVTQALLPRIRDTQGRIVNIGSVAGRVASPFLGPYSTSKFALRALSDSLRRELAAFGVFVSLVEPGPIQTPIWQKSTDDGLARLAAMDPRLKKIYQIQLDRFLKQVAQIPKITRPVSAATAAIEKALTDRYPKPYYSTALPHCIARIIGSVVPGRILDLLIRRFS